MSKHDLPMTERAQLRMQQEPIPEPPGVSAPDQSGFSSDLPTDFGPQQTGSPQAGFQSDLPTVFRSEPQTIFEPGPQNAFEPEPQITFEPQPQPPESGPEETVPDFGELEEDADPSYSEGELRFVVTASLGFIPIEGAKITIRKTEEPEQVVGILYSNESGRTAPILLATPLLAYSLSPSRPRPYAEYDILVEAPGYETVEISGTEVLPNEVSIQPVRMEPERQGEPEEEIIIPDHTLYGEYPPKIPEAEIKPMDESGEIVLSRVVIPEYIIVHDGVPQDSSAQNYYVRYRDYIKNVASSEIYATWPQNAIYANVLVIMSFTLNRVYTEWYRNQGYDFTITSSTAYDQKWIYGRNIYENIDYLVDTIFNNFLSRPGVRQPIFTSYCDGQRVTCSGLSQWGSKYLAEQGYSAIEIIRYYYGNDMYINSTDAISGVPSSWPGYDLTVGSTGQKVQQMQEQLNRIAQNYPALPRISADGVFGTETQEAVRTFQRIFNLPQTGIVDYATWYEISEIFVGVSRIAEPD